VTINVPASACSRAAPVLLPSLASITATCAGTVSSAPQYDCVPSASSPVPTSTQAISYNIVDGVAVATTTIGLVTLHFIPVNNNNPVMTFVLSSPLFTVSGGGSSGVLLSAVNSGFTDTAYSSELQTPVWICGGQMLDAIDGSVTVTMVNVGDALYPSQIQTVQFLYQIQ